MRASKISVRNSKKAKRRQNEKKTKGINIDNDVTHKGGKSYNKKNNGKKKEDEKIEKNRKENR